MKGTKIQDEFTDLPVSAQRKWQMRNPGNRALINARDYKNHREERLLKNKIHKRNQSLLKGEKK